MVTTEPVAAHALRMLAESFVRRRWEQAIAAATHVRLLDGDGPTPYTVANAACQWSSVLVCLPACWFCLRFSSETRAMLWCVCACCRHGE